MAPNTKGFYLPWSQERTVAIVERHRAKLGALMPILHELQDVFGHIDARAVDLVAEALNLSKAEVYGVVTFYKDFRSERSEEHTSELQSLRHLVCRLLL